MVNKMSSWVVHGGAVDGIRAADGHLKVSTANGRRAG
jgi:hypothetical protein